MELRLPAIKGIGGAPLYLIDRFEDGKSIYDIDFEWLPGVDRRPKGVGLTVIDHLTHNVYRGRMAHWAAFYERLFNFRELRYFDIQGEYTGLTSKAMTAPDGMIRIPLNEESGKNSGQIEEFLMKFSGEGIQHVALLTDNLLETVDKLQMAGVPLMTAPNDIYYEMLEERLPGHGQPVGALQARGILLDGDTTGAEPPQAGRQAGAAGDAKSPFRGAEPPQAGRQAGAAGDAKSPSRGGPRLLLQIFSETLFGPVFFEFIQRAGDDGFGNGNFKALFESLERDQIRRGVLQVEKANA
jgi:4-hydroxyphenylpyruvate dioxygenase